MKWPLGTIIKNTILKKILSHNQNRLGTVDFFSHHHFFFSFSPSLLTWWWRFRFNTFDIHPHRIAMIIIKIYDNQQETVKETKKNRKYNCELNKRNCRIFFSVFVAKKKEQKQNKNSPPVQWKIHIQIHIFLTL